jgi:hypothetical protein
MAVYNDYVDANLVLKKLGNAPLVSGAAVITAIQAWSVAATDDATSVYRVFPNIPSDAIILSLEIMNEAVTGATGALIGLYKSKSFDGVGAILGSGNQFHTNFNLSSANAIASNWVDAMPAVSIANREVSLWSLASEQQAPPASSYGPKGSSYDICLTMVNKTTVATGAIVMKLSYIRGV